MVEPSERDLAPIAVEDAENGVRPSELYIISEQCDVANEYAPIDMAKESEEVKDLSP